MEKKRLLLGTRNPAKIAIFRAVLEHLPLQVLTLQELGIDVEVEEDGASARENAEKKARAYLAATGVPTLANDGAVRIERFPEEKQPGAWVKRVRGQEVTDEEVLAYYVQELAAAGGTSLAHWCGAMALALSPEQMMGETFFFSAQLLLPPRGPLLPGVPLDCLMVEPGTGKRYTEMSWQERPYYRPVMEFLERYAGLL